MLNKRPLNGGHQAPESDLFIHNQLLNLVDSAGRLTKLFKHEN
jgi:hypothetical protein